MATSPTPPPSNADRPGPLYLTWGDIGAATQDLSEQVTVGGMPQVVVGIVRGGMIPAVWLAHRLEIRDVRTVEVTRTTGDGINAAKTRLPTTRNPASLGDLTGLDVLLVDDIAGSGATLAHTADLLRDLGPARVRTAVLTVNRANWAQEADPARVIDYIASLNDTWIVFPWEDSMSAELDEQYRTRPGTPMIGPYSTNQMDDFYTALGRGEAKPSGLMNLMQHLIATERCEDGANVLDVCCGRGLALPLLHRYAPKIGRYVGLDISPDNLAEAHMRLTAVRQEYGSPFPVDFVECDVSDPWPQLPPFDVALYTSALEHLPSELGVKSLAATGAALAPGGVLYLSTPQAFGPPPRPLQYRVHVYEWSREEVVRAVEAAGLVVDDVMGLLPPEPDGVAAELAERYGTGAVDWYRDLAARVPKALLDTVSSVAVPDRATELLFVCRRPA